MTNKWRRTGLKLLRDLFLIALIIYAVSAWQTRNMLITGETVATSNHVLVSLQGETQPLLNPNKRNLVYFFAPWCSVCAFSINNLEALNADDLNIVRVALDYQSKEEVEAFVMQNQVEGQVLLGNRELQSKFKIQGYPSYYLLDENSLILAKSMGYSSAIGLRATSYLNR